MTSLGQQSMSADGSKSHGEHLATCNEEEVAQILSQIQGVLPVVNVFFEFGRQGAIFGQPNIEAFRLLNIAHHTRLQNVGQVIACLDVISQAFSRVCGDTTATFCGFDREDHCFITLETQQSILHLWQKVIAGQQLASDSLNGLSSASMPAGTAKSSGNSAEAVAVPSQRPDSNGKEAAAHSCCS